MGHKIFISYKYADNQVYKLENTYLYSTTVRNYVDNLEAKFDSSNHIYKGESDGEDLSQFSEKTIWEKLKNRIYDSTLTIIMLSAGMRDGYKADKDQWIPWEISYSLKEISRINSAGNSITSKTNALLALILPDTNNSFSFFTSNKSCCSSGCVTYYRSNLFDIMKNNMFNQKKPSTKDCDDGSTVYYGDSSYMLCVKWNDFINNMDTYIDKSYEIQDKMDEYIIQKEV